MATKKVTPAMKQAKDAQIGDGINRKIIDKGRAINAAKMNGKMPMKRGKC